MTAHPRFERRQFGRRESALYAVAIIPGRAPAHCIVRNVSERGALLEFNERIVPPFRFRLLIESKGVDVHCEVRHQGLHGVGVSIVSGSMAGLFEAQPGPPAASSAVPPRTAPPATIQKLSGADLRSALFGPPKAEPVRSFNPAAGGIIRDT